MFKGAKVSIVRTDNVESRYPERIGQVGVIYDVPIHPNTWYKVQFSDGKILTFRPSALMSINDKGEVFDSPQYFINLYNFFILFAYIVPTI